ncbi:MAG: hypothetical protein ABI746_09355 [Dermatophilaceae bacterium]
MARYCPECGSQFTPQAKFCVSCGSPVPGSAPTASDVDAATVSSATLDGTGPTPHVPRASSASADSGSGTAPMNAGFVGWPDEIPDPWSGASAAIPGAGPASGSGLHGTMDPVGSNPARRRRPYVLSAASVAVVLVVAALAWGATQRGVAPDAPSAPAAATVLGTTQSTTDATSSPDAATTDVKRSSDAFTATLRSGQSSRETLVRGIATYCDGEDKAAGQRQIQEALQGRLAQLAKLTELGNEPFREVSGAPAARDKLRAALQASADADQVYLRMAEEGSLACPVGDAPDLVTADQKASAAKESFLASWNPIATGAGLAPMSREDI